MRTSGLMKVCGFGLAMLLVLAPVVPAGAEASGRGFDLGLEQALGSEMADFKAAVTPEEPAGEELSAAQDVAPPIRLASLQEAAWQRSQQQQQQATQSSPQPKKRGFGRWLKRHWWVPVLVGVAVGVVLLDDDSDGPNEDDD